jgi:predicted histone-like DNA-binding protein
MSVSYKLILRKNPQNSAAPKKYYAIVSNREVSFDTICQQVADGCTLTSADIKAVIDRLVQVLSRNLANSNTVRMGELGSFRVSLSSSGSTTSDTFKASLIRGARVLFSPGATLKTALSSVSYSRVADSTTASAASAASAEAEIEED